MTKPILIFTVTTDLNYDQRMIRICSALYEDGYEVKIIGREKKNSIQLTKRPYIQKRLKCFFETGALFYVEFNLRLFCYLLFQKFDLICGIDLDTILPATFISKIKRKKCVYDAHEYFTEVPELISRPRIQRIWEGIARFCIPKTDARYTVCNSLAELMGKRYDVPFQLIRNVPVAYEMDFDTMPEKKQKIILYQGALNEGRGLEETIEAMTYIQGAVLEIAGEGTMSSQLRELVKQNKLDHHVKFLGYLKPKELKLKTLEAYIGLNLLKNKGLNYYYSLANKTFDYIHAEVPAIHMGFPEYIQINEADEIGILIEELNAENITAALHVLLNDDNHYQKLKDNCRAAKDKYNWETEQQKLKKIYSQLLNRSTANPDQT